MKTTQDIYHRPKNRVNLFWETEMKHLLISEINKNIGDFNTLVITALMETICKKNAMFSLYKCSKITFEGSLSFLVTFSVVLVNYNHRFVWCRRRV